MAGCTSQGWRVGKPIGEEAAEPGRGHRRGVGGENRSEENGGGTWRGGGGAGRKEEERGGTERAAPKERRREARRTTVKVNLASEGKKNERIPALHAPLRDSKIS